MEKAITRRRLDLLDSHAIDLHLSIWTLKGWLDYVNQPEGKELQELIETTKADSAEMINRIQNRDYEPAGCQRIRRKSWRWCESLYPSLNSRGASSVSSCRLCPNNSK